MMHTPTPLRLRLGCRITYDLPQPSPMILLLNVHYSRAGDLERPDWLITEPSVPVESYRDGFGNWCARLVAPAGHFTLRTEGVLRDAGLPDPIGYDAAQMPVEALPADALEFLLPSRYCDSDLLLNRAWELFGHTPPGWARVQAICDFVHNHIRFDYATADPTRTAAGALEIGQGVCRDFAHLAVAFCRALNIPARYCTGYISDVNQPQPWPPQDFAAFMDVYLGGQWWVFDPRNNDTRYGRVLVGRGRDAADVPLTHSFGPHRLEAFHVWVEALEPAGAPL